MQFNVILNEVVDQWAIVQSYIIIHQWAIVYRCIIIDTSTSSTYAATAITLLQTRIAKEKTSILGKAMKHWSNMGGRCTHAGIESRNTFKIRVADGRFTGLIGYVPITAIAAIVYPSNSVSTVWIKRDCRSWGRSGPRATTAMTLLQTHPTKDTRIHFSQNNQVHKQNWREIYSRRHREPKYLQDSCS